MVAIAERLAKVLIIDDNDIDAMVCSKVFKKCAPQVEIEVNHGAKEALDNLNLTLKNNPEDLPDLIILDLYMPLMNGWYFLDEYAKIAPKIDKRIKILVASCTSYDKDLHQIMNYKEIDGYISKPFSLEKIKSIQEKYFT